jgi:hypothetical protein
VTARPRVFSRRWLAGALAAVLVVAAACSTATQGTVTVSGPDRTTFAPVAQALVHRCGTLDCHGTAYRNLRIYGNEGQRLSPTDRPLVPGCTTTAEVDGDYAALVGLEPEAMAQFVAAGGAANPESLLFVRKALGIELHKPGAIVAAGSDFDTCVRSWLLGAVDAAACARTAPPTFPVTATPSCQAGP